jgi:hypothetical protein
MNYSDEQVAELKQIVEGAQPCAEGGIPYFFLPKLRLPDGCSLSEVDALLCPTAHHGYTSRLFFSQRFSSPTPRNWSTTAHILGRNWEAISWSFQQNGLSLAQILALHLRAFR